jgi:glycosyltransferase involved in cell wall biosynthesis
MKKSVQKKILCISDHGRFLGGGEHSFLDLCRNLKANHKAIAVVPCLGELSKTLEEYGIKTHGHQFASIKPYLIHKAFMSGKKLIKLIYRINPDVIYANGARSALYCGLLKFIHKKPLIWHCRIADRALISDMLLTHLCDCIIANSQATRKRFNEQIHHKVKVIYNGFDLEWLTHAEVKKPQLLKDDWFNILVVSRLSRWKKHDIVLAAFEKVAQNLPNAHLILLGAKDPFQPEWWNHLQKKANSSKYSERIHWIGHVNDVRPWYKGAHVLVLASVNEPFGRVIIEAMATGIPVIASRSGGVPEIITHGKDGFLTQPGSSKEIAEYIQLIFNKKNLKNKLTTVARKRAQSFHMKNHLLKMVEVFNQTVVS